MFPHSKKKAIRKELWMLAWGVYPLRVERGMGTSFRRPRQTGEEYENGKEKCIPSKIEEDHKPLTVGP